MSEKFYYGKVSFEQIVPTLHSLVMLGKTREAKEFAEGVMLEIKKAEERIITFREVIKYEYDAG